MRGDDRTAMRVDDRRAEEILARVRAELREGAAGLYRRSRPRQSPLTVGS